MSEITIERYVQGYNNFDIYAVIEGKKLKMENVHEMYELGLKPVERLTEEDMEAIPEMPAFGSREGEVA